MNFEGANIGGTGLVCHLMTVLQANAEAIVRAVLSNQIQAHIAIGGGDVLHGLAKLLQLRLVHLLWSASCSGVEPTDSETH